MAYCQKHSIVKHTGTTIQAATLKCKCWACEDCEPGQREGLRKLALAGHPNKFLTLTVNPHLGVDQAQRAQALVWAWRVLVKRLARKQKVKKIEHMWVMEATKKGEAHLHILLRSDWIDQSYISEAMRELIKAPIVWIRRIADQGKMASYVAKYCSKDLAKFTGCKRYGYTRGWAVDAEYLEQKEARKDAGWRKAAYGIEEVERECLMAGAVVTWTSKRTFAAVGVHAAFGDIYYQSKLSGHVAGETQLSNEWKRHAPFEPGWADDRLEADITREGYASKRERKRAREGRPVYKRFRPPADWTRTRRRGENITGEIYSVGIWEERVDV